MNFMEGLLEGAKSVAPSLVGMAANLIVPGSGNFVNGLVRKVAGVSADTSIEEAAEIVKNDPNLYAQYLMQMGLNEARFRELDSKDLETINKTMQTESQSKHWPQWAWRPFNGFMFISSF